MSAWPPPDPPGGPRPPGPPPAGYAAPPGTPGQPPPYAPGGFAPGYPMPPQRRGTDGLAITALVLGILGFLVLTPIVAIVLGIVALGRIRRTRQDGRGLAISGIVLGAVWTLLLGFGIIAAVTSGPDREPSGDVVNPGRFATEDLMVGDCVTDPPGGSVPRPSNAFAVVPCSQLHTGEVYAAVDLPDGPYPGAVEAERLAAVGCVDRIAGYAPTASTDPGLTLAKTYPTEGGWNRGNRRVLCFAVTEGATTGSLKGR